METDNPRIQSILMPNQSIFDQEDSLGSLKSLETSIQQALNTSNLAPLTIIPIIRKFIFTFYGVLGSYPVTVLKNLDYKEKESVIRKK